MEIRGILDYHLRSICAPSFEGKKKALELVLFLLLRCCKVRYKAEVLRSVKAVLNRVIRSGRLKHECRVPAVFASRL
jgi:hypothetical protein